MLLIWMGISLITMYMFALVVESGCMYYVDAFTQVTTDAILEGAAIAADTGIVNADEYDSYGVFKNQTELSGKKADLMAEKICQENLKDKPKLIKSYTFDTNALGTLDFGTGRDNVHMEQLSYEQRVLGVAGGSVSEHMFNLFDTKTYGIMNNGCVFIVGVEIPLADSIRFSEMYPDDPRIPISALVFNDGATMRQVFKDYNTFLGTANSGKSLLSGINDGRSAALYRAVLDQFGVTVSKGITTTRYRIGQYTTTEFYDFSDEYVYTDARNAVTLTPSSTLLWDISVAMNMEVARYVDVANNCRSSYYDWYKGRENVKLVELEFPFNTNNGLTSGTYDAHHIYSDVNSISEAIEYANSGSITFAVKDGVCYFIRPTITDSAEPLYEYTGNYVNCMYTDGTNGANDILVDLSGAELYTIFS